MIIGIDIRAAFGKRAGKGNYVYYLLEALSKLPEAKKHRFVLYCNNEPDFPFHLSSRYFSFRVSRLPSLLWHLWVAFRVNCLNDVDIFLATTSFIIPAISRKGKCIVSVPDLVSFMYPTQHNPKAVFVEKFTTKPALRKAKKILPISKSTAKDIIERFGIDKKKIKTIYLAASEAFRVIKDNYRRMNRIENLSIPKSFILFVGTLEPRKNIVRILEAYSRIVKRNSQAPKLVLIGGRGWYYDEVFEKIKELGLIGRVVAAGYVKDEDLVYYYNLAKMLVFPSLYEGFGIPVLEAMKCGCPVITSNVSSLPEVAGDAALLVDPESVTEISRAIRKLLRNERLRKKLISNGFKQASKFSWEETAKETLEELTK